MTTFFQFAIIGLGLGSIYALSAVGLVLVYRGSGVLNFAHGAFGMVSAFVWHDLYDGQGWPFLAALAGGILAGAGLGLATHFFVMRPLRHAPPLTKLIATLGILIFLQGAMIEIKSGDVILVNSPFGYDMFHLFGAFIFRDRLILLGIAVALTTVLYLIYRFTTFGLATTAVSEDELGYAGLGRSPDLIAAINWALGGGLAALAAILIASITGLDPVGLSMLIVPALAAALLGGFASFWITLAAGLGIGVTQSVITSHTTFAGVTTLVPFAVLIGVIVFRGRGLPIRGEVGARLPRLGSGRIRPVALLLALVLIGLIWTISGPWIDFLTTSLIFAIVLLSIVVVTGLGGQLSLAQYALAGVGAWIAGSLVGLKDAPLWLAIVAALFGTIALGIVVGLPALRTRGVNLAVVTLGLAAAVTDVIFFNIQMTGGATGTKVGQLHLFGVSFFSITHPERFATLAVVVFAILLVLVANLRRSHGGLKLVAVRSNEKAAASLGIPVGGLKIYAFAFSAGIAAVAGILNVFRYEYANYTAYTVFASITAAGMAVIAGVGYVLGPVLGIMLAPFGLGYEPLLYFPRIADYFVAFGGVLLVVMLIQNPNGLASTHNVRNLKRLLPSRLRRGLSPPPAAEPAETSTPAELPRPNVRPAVLEVKGMTVRFGNVTAVEDVSLDVQPGEIHGLIGPNGAGKTTFIDALSGFVTPSAGEVAIGGQSLTRLPAHKRVALGLTRSFQTLELFEDLTVAENLRAGIPADLSIFITGVVWPQEVPLNEGAVAAIHEFGIVNHQHVKPEVLSYGQRRLVAIARAVATLPSIILLDEPAAGLDEVHRRELSALLTRLARVWGIGILLVEHDVDMILDICDRVTVLDTGRLLATGTPREVLQDPAVINAYLGVESDVQTLERAGPAALPVES